MINGFETEKAPDLLTCFFNECERRFRFLEEEYGYTYISGLSSLVNGRQIIRPYNLTPVSVPFWAVTRYEKGYHAFEIVYGDKEFIIEGYCYANSVDRLSWPEILQAAKRPYENYGAFYRALSQKSIAQQIGRMADQFKACKGELLNPDQKVIERALKRRSVMLEQTIRQNYQTMLELVIKESAAAFSLKNYKRVIELLAPYERDLQESDKKKLKLARRNLLGGHDPDQGE